MSKLNEIILDLIKSKSNAIDGEDNTVVDDFDFQDLANDIEMAVIERIKNYSYSKEELLELKKKWCAEAFDAGFEKCGENMIDHLIEISKPLPDKETFLNNIKL